MKKIEQLEKRFDAAMAVIDEALASGNASEALARIRQENVQLRESQRATESELAERRSEVETLQAALADAENRLADAERNRSPDPAGTPDDQLTPADEWLPVVRSLETSVLDLKTQFQESRDQLATIHEAIGTLSSGNATGVGAGSDDTDGGDVIAEEATVEPGVGSDRQRNGPSDLERIDAILEQLAPLVEGETRA
ncbi:MAG: hypothetical protein OXL68_18210 [Paracoccaceae bacterium]|nr:hypothetical protein [Paracoccaceae bacterium]